MAAEMNKTQGSALEDLSDQWGTDKLTDDYKTGGGQAEVSMRYCGRAI